MSSSVIEVKTKSQKGQSLVEVLGALAVLVIVVLSLVAVNTRSVYNAAFARDQASATQHSQEVIEKIRVYREQNSWATFIGNCESVPGLGPLPLPFNLSVSCNCFAGDSCDIQVVVGWTDSLGTHQSELTTRLTDWR